MDEPILIPRDEPALNVPRVVAWLIGLLVVIHVVRAFLLTVEQDSELIVWFSFIPARYDPEVGQAFPGGLVADVLSPLTYSLLHGDFLHLGVNAVWLAAFGSALAWRFGAGRFLLFSAGAALGGALAHYLSHSGEAIPMVGASGAISGHMAAVSRFMFQNGGPVAPFARNPRHRFSTPAVSLPGILRDRRILAFLGLWFAINLIAGFGLLIPTEEGVTVAWEAHVGGFLFGILAFGWFDPVGNKAPQEPCDD